MQLLRGSAPCAPPACHGRRSLAVKAAARQQQAAAAAADVSGSSRRQALAAALAAAAAGSLFARPANASLANPTVCADQATGEEADVCRAAVLERDAGKQEDYAKFEGRGGRTATNVPVAAMDDEYSRATLALADKMETYFGMDPYNKTRVALQKEIRTEAQAWVTKYARGGSVRKQSARRFYVAVDAVLGFFASNGLAPYPVSKARTVKASIEDARALLAEGK